MSRRPPSSARSRLDRTIGGRSESLRQRRLTRTVLLGSLAVAAAIAWLALEWEVDYRMLIDYALVSLLLVLAAVVLAAAGGLLLWGARRWRRRR